MSMHTSTRAWKRPTANKFHRPHFLCQSRLPLQHRRRPIPRLFVGSFSFFFLVCLSRHDRVLVPPHFPLCVTIDDVTQYVAALLAPTAFLASRSIAAWRNVSSHKRGALQYSSRPARSTDLTRYRWCTGGGIGFHLVTIMPRTCRRRPPGVCSRSNSVQ